MPILSSTFSSANTISLLSPAIKESSSSISSSLSNDSLNSWESASSLIESVFSIESTSLSSVSVDSVTFASIESSKSGLMITPPSIDSSSKASDPSKSLYSLWIGMISFRA